ncbi:hypothetical protein PCK2_000222, partial [Pneumocystis canis]
LLNELNSEFIQLLCFSYFENGFYSQSHGLDHYISHDNPYFKKHHVSSGKQSNTPISCHGFRLGENGNTENKPLRDLIRDATEKRIKNLKWSESESSIIIEDSEIPVECKERIPFTTLLTNSNLNNFLSEKQITTSEYKSVYVDVIPEKLWFCSSCTFENHVNHLQCQLCLLERPSNTSKFNTEWECIICSYVNQKHQFSCEFCNTIKA